MGGIEILNTRKSLTQQSLNKKEDNQIICFPEHTVNNSVYDDSSGTDTPVNSPGPRLIILFNSIQLHELLLTRQLAGSQTVLLPFHLSF